MAPEMLRNAPGVSSQAERVFAGNAGVGDGSGGMESESAIIAGIADEHGGRMPQCGGLGEGLADEGRSDALGAPFERHG